MSAARPRPQARPRGRPHGRRRARDRGAPREGPGAAPQRPSPTRCGSWPTSTPSRAAASSCGSSRAAGGSTPAPSTPPPSSASSSTDSRPGSPRRRWRPWRSSRTASRSAVRRVSAVRGVNCDGVMRTLLQRGLVEEAGAEPETGAILYRTTNYFLERMGLRGLDELPELAPFLPEAEAIEAETQEGVPSFDPDAPDTDDETTRRRRNFDASSGSGREQRRTRQLPGCR